MMSSESIHITTRYLSYDPYLEKKGDNILVDKTYTFVSPPTNGLQIEKPVHDAVLWTPKSTIRKSIFNASAHDSQYYNVVEYLSHAPCVISTLEVLQTCPA